MIWRFKLVDMGYDDGIIGEACAVLRLRSKALTMLSEEEQEDEKQY